MILDAKTRAAITGALRRVWSRHPMKLAALKAVEIREFPVNANGERAKRPLVFYICAMCNTRAKSSRSPHYPVAHVDHKNPVKPVTGESLSWDEIIERMFVTSDQLQVLCEDCHQLKTVCENAIRRDAKKELKNAS